MVCAIAKSASLVPFTGKIFFSSFSVFIGRLKRQHNQLAMAILNSLLPRVAGYIDMSSRFDSSASFINFGVGCLGSPIASDIADFLDLVSTLFNNFFNFSKG